MAKNAAVPKKKFKKEWLKGYLFILPNFIGFLIFMGIPIIMGLVISFTNYDGFKTFDFVGLSNYIKMFSDEYFQVSFINNLVYTGVTVPCTVVIALLLAVALNVGIKGTGLFLSLIHISPLRPPDGFHRLPFPAEFRLRWRFRSRGWCRSYALRLQRNWPPPHRSQGGR